MLELLLYPIYFAVYLPIVLYPIPYINTKIIKQRVFIDICEYNNILKMHVLLLLAASRSVY